MSSVSGSSGGAVSQVSKGSGGKGPRTGFDPVPSAAWAHFARIGPFGYALLGALANHLNKKRECWPSVSRLAAMLGCTSRHVTRKLSELRGCGLVEITPRPGTTSVYRLPPTPDTSVTTDTHVTPRPPTLVSPTPDTGVETPPTPRSTEPDIRTRSGNQKEMRSEYLEDFELWKSTLPATSAVQVKPSEDRLRKYSARRRDSKRDEIRDALKGWQYDPWPERKQNNDFSILLRDRGQVEKFARLYRERDTQKARSGPAGLDATRRSKYAEIDEAASAAGGGVR